MNDVIQIFEENGWDWTYHAFREADCWSVESDPTNRKDLLLQYLAKNIVTVASITTNLTEKASDGSYLAYGDSYEVYANGVSGATRVLFPTWTNLNGQDELEWMEGVYEPANNRWKAVVIRSKHKNEYGLYFTHVYGINNAGEAKYIGAVSVTLKSQSVTVFLFQETFDTTPFSGGWKVYDSSLKPADGTVKHNTSLTDACGQSKGYIYREYAGTRYVEYTGTLNTSGYTNLKLKFSYKNSSSTSIDAQVNQNGVWVNAATVGTSTAWQTKEVSLTGAVTGIRFILKSGINATRSLDCISITGERTYLTLKTE